MRIRTLLTGMVAVLMSGCATGGPGTGSARPAEDVLFLRTPRGVALVKARADAVAVHFSDAVPSTDWSAVVQSITRDGDTYVEAFDTSSGDELWSRPVARNLEVKVASQDGRQVVLGRTGDDGGYPPGRSSTRFVVIDQETAEPRELTLEGNYEPEAFSTDGGSLFVIEYLPPRDPTSYQVRRLDLTTGEVGGVYTVDAELQERMQGTARVQAASPNGDRLYTLYSLKDPDGSVHSFVHVLSLDEEWAHCVDLPDTFEIANERAIAMSVAPDGGRLYVADALSGALAEIDTEALTVTRTAEVTLGPWGGRAAHAARGADGKLYIGSGSRLLSIDAATLSPGRSWDLQDRINGIQAGTDGSRLYVGLKDRIAVIDTGTGRALEALTPDRIEAIEQLGQSTRVLVQGRKRITCAC